MLVIEENNKNVVIQRNIEQQRFETLMEVLFRIYYGTVINWYTFFLTSFLIDDVRKLTSDVTGDNVDPRENCLSEEYFGRPLCHRPATKNRYFVQKQICASNGGTIHCNYRGRKKIDVKFPAHSFSSMCLKACLQVLQNGNFYHDVKTEGRLAGPIVYLGPSGTVFTKSVQVTLPLFIKEPDSFQPKTFTIMVSQTKAGEKPKWKRLYTHYRISNQSDNCTITFDVPHFSVYKVLWNIADTVLPERVKLQASNSVSGFSFWTHFEAYMTNCNSERQFAICIVGYRKSNEHTDDVIHKGIEEYPLNVGRCKPKKIRTGKIRIKLKSDMFDADVSIGEESLTKDVIYTGHEIDVQFSCVLSNQLSVPNLEIFGKVFVSQLNDENEEVEGFSFNLIRKNQTNKIPIQMKTVFPWNDTKIGDLADLLSSDKYLWNKLALNLGYSTFESNLKFGNSPKPVVDIFNDHVCNHHGNQEGFQDALIEVADYFNISSNPSKRHSNEVVESQQLVFAKKRTFEDAFSNDQSKLEEYELDEIAGQISRSWKQVGRHLYIQETCLNEIDLRTGLDEREKAFQMLLEWRERYPEKFTVGRLHNVLSKCGLRYTAKQCLAR